VGAFLLRRVINYLVLTFVATSLAFFLASATMNPASNFAGPSSKPRSQASIYMTLTRYNLNPHTSILTRYWHWLDHAVAHLNLGYTWTGASVNSLLGEKAVVSLRLLIAGTIIGTLGGIALGAWNAVRQYKASDHASTVMVYLVYSMPVIVLAVVLEQLAIWLNHAWGSNIINYTGEKTPGLNQDLWHGFLDDVSHQVVPTLALALLTAAQVSRYQRSVMLDVLGSDFVRTARAKGLRRRTALRRHALRCALIPTATLSAYTLVTMFTGATLTEMIFGWHGMGEWLVTTIDQNDINAIAAIAGFTSVLVLLGGLVSDLLVALLDPRVRVD
jgi:peptide/nickel transport system permease protein